MDYKRLMANWNSVFSAAGWITGTVFGFWKAPMPDPAASTSATVSFSRFVVAIVVAAVTPLLFNYRRRQHARAWAFLTAAVLLLAVVSFLSYDDMKNTWITQGSVWCPARTLVGNYDGLLPFAKQYYDGHPECRTNDCLLAKASCDPGTAWTAESISNHRLWLNAAYIGLVPIFACAMLCAGQVLCCMTSAQTAPRRYPTAGKTSRGRNLPC